MTDRRHVTFRCFGCPAFVHERLAAHSRKPKGKPPAWELRRAMFQEADGGVVREVQLPFCSRECADYPDTNSPMARKVHAYLGHAGPPPSVVTFRCVGCAKTVESHTRVLPSPWQMSPLDAPDFDTGAARKTSLPVCSEECLMRGIRGHTQSVVAAAESRRLLLGRGV